MSDDLQTLIKRSDHLEVIRYIRRHKLREPSVVVEHGLSLLGPDLIKARLDDSERLAALEQLCESALDVFDHNLAELCLTQIHAGGVSKESARFRRLLGLCLEAAGDLEGATALYDSMLKENPANSVALRRKYAMLRSRPGQEANAREALNVYLENNSGDGAGWAEMGDLGHDRGDSRAASFAYEEVTLSSPLDAPAHRRLGELYATVGGISNLKMARKHLAQSLELDPSDVRTLYGLVAVADAYLKENSQAGKSKREAEEEDAEVAKELIKYGADKLLKIYRGSGRMGKVVETVLMELTNNL